MSDLAWRGEHGRFTRVRGNQHAYRLNCLNLAATGYPTAPIVWEAESLSHEIMRSMGRFLVAAYCHRTRRLLEATKSVAHLL